MPNRYPAAPALAGLVCLTAGAIAQADVRNIAIAPLDEALTFARIGPLERARVIAVTEYAGGTVSGVDLSALVGRPVDDPIAIVESEGWEPLRQRIAGAPADMLVRVPAAELVLPLALGDHHVAAGTNYPEHAGEAEVEDGPFLFAKLVTPTSSRAPVAAGEALLDYEVELAFVPFEPIREGEPLPTIGLLLSNDYTDRATLLRHVDVWDPTSGKGFTTGKSAPGYLPVGDLFVVPRDVRAFAAPLELRLWVNGAPRQQAQVSAQIWDLDRLLAETWARRDVTWEHRGDQVSLLAADGSIPARSLILSGTPGGTVFQGVGWGTRARGLRTWVSGGWSTPVATTVVETYITEAHAAGDYLQPGDQVTIRVDRLGVIDNLVVR
jgi:2-keto-4-pentenoate hydratase/2-oxohepta-3-ene-1,7-dioic acid hydratase in catechol pathway